MTTFQSVNVGLGPHEHQFGVTTPTTPRAPVQHQSQPQSQPATIAEEQSTTTPTSLSFGGLSGQRPLPTSPFGSSFSSQLLSTNQPTPGILSRGHSHQSTQSTQSTVSDDVDVDMSDEGEGASDDESVDAETGNILENDLSNVIARADSRVWTTYGNMLRPDQNIRSRPTIDTFVTRPMTPPSQQGFSKESSEGLSTPTSTTFSNGASSPGYGSTFGSPVSTTSRNGGYWGSNSYHGRRLSVPSGPNPFQSPHANSYPNPYLSPLAPSNSSLASSNSSVYGSPTGSTYAFPRRETPEEIEWRRRTWHSSTYHNYPRPATSGLSYYRTPDDAPQPGFAPQAAATPRRLPGIETFDQVPNRTASPVRRGGSPMQIDAPNRPPIYPGSASTSGPNDRRGHASWDLSLHQNLTKLDIANSTPPKESGYWSKQAVGEPRPSNNDAYGSQPQQTTYQPQSTPVIVHHNSHDESVSAFNPPSATPYRAKRQGWYNGPLNAPQPKVAQRSPEGSSSSEGVHTPSFSTAEYNPSIVTSDGYIEPHPPAHEKQESNMTGLDVLVAVATNEDNARNTNGQSPPS
ncbi:MAG: hypothetical protein Q9218_006187 [Villophora microphyllina]